MRGWLNMYLTVKQHDKLRNIVMNFEIPFRSYISSVIVNNFQDVSSFATEVSKRNMSLSNLDTNFIRSQAGKLSKKIEKLYDTINMCYLCWKNKKVIGEINVPDVADLIALTFLFKDIFNELYSCFPNEDVYKTQVEKYHYVRNKLSHPGCKTLEDNDMKIVLSFISDVSMFIASFEPSLFWQKNVDELYQEIRALETSDIHIPIPIHNILDMPLPDRQIVCRDKEIEYLKQFVYGMPGALKKKSSICIFGYGGVGKTALVLETIKSIVQDIQDGNTINNYKPDFILFFSAKEESLDISYTTGKIYSRKIRQSYKSADELKHVIFSALNIESFEGFEKHGIIIVDNLETLDEDERKKVMDFIQFMSPPNVQYIITSRNEEEYEERKKIEGFEAELGKSFIDNYIEENNLNLELSEEDKYKLIDLSKGNTLVLVLCLRRLSKRLATLEGIISDFSQIATIQKMEKEFLKLPINGYEIISEFMFKNTFQELERIFYADTEMIYSILKIFAVYPADSVDIYTISLLTKKDYSKIEPIILLLCRYLIIEKKGDSYSLNRFAEKYIIQRFLPDSETYLQLSSKIEKSVREIRSELDKLDEDINRYTGLKNIIKDWCIETDGDMIAAAKAYRLFKDVQLDCRKGKRFFVESALQDAIETIDTIEKTTMHPYVKYQKARILQLIDKCNILSKSLDKLIVEAYRDAIWTIKTNMLYSKIKTTKSYASVLWLFGMYLFEKGNFEEALRYLEDASSIFDKLNIRDEDFYKCYTQLGKTYFMMYITEKNIAYLLKSREVSNRLYEERNNYASNKTIKNHATLLRNTLLRYSGL